MELFLDNTRTKFVGFKLSEDSSSLAGLPPPIHEGAKILNQYIYRSLAESQIKREEEIAANPLSRPELDVAQTPAEVCYRLCFDKFCQLSFFLIRCSTKPCCPHCPSI